MKKRLARILAVTLGAATLLTGCGGNSGQKTSDSSKKSDDQMIRRLQKTLQRRKVKSRFGQI